MIRILSLLCLLFFASGCLRLGPDFHRPEMDFDIPQEYVHAPGIEGPEDTILYWWQSFQDHELNDLVRHMLQKNPDLVEAAAKVRELEADLVQAKSDRWPDLKSQASFTRQEASIEVAVPEFANGEGAEAVIVDTYRISFPASFEIDLWGRLARAEESAQAVLLQSKENQKTLLQGLIAETVTSYIKLAGLIEQEVLQRRIIQSYEKSFEIVRLRFSNGLKKLFELKQAKRILEQSKVLMEELREERGIARHALALLLGSYPASQDLDPKFKTLWSHNPAFPSDLPSNLIVRRPDVQAAEAKVRSANAKIGLALANRFPNFSLTGNLGYSQTDQFEGLIHPENRFWQWALSMSQTLFDRGGLKAKQEAAQARYDQEVAAYVKTVLQAFSEVEDALLVSKAIQKRLDELERVSLAATDEFQIARDRYKRGILELDQMLNAQRAMFETKKSLIESQTALLINRVTLYRVLGGDWRSPSHESGQSSAQR
jgi:multidrug efflux system outer membrane protein